ncbi:DsbA family protein [Thiomonas sp.]|jgi:putative protein-disulfide isomerase|uniref:DsbA family protein n=1 Tax=Thiomonas sp. TaxID=2047785 RepID=UPI00261730ED|nr:DsbA family protein [Thiomonas sp.]
MDRSEGPHLVYFADPMCSWCWGFSPVIEAIGERFGEQLPIRLVLGGLRPGTVEPMDDQERTETRGHWRHVHEASGQPFDWSFFDREGFVYDTEPASRAVVLMRRRGPAEALAGLRRLQRAFYAEGRDVTDLDQLAELAGELDFEPREFRAGLDDVTLLHETRADFELAAQSGVRGFPTLIAGSGGARDYVLLTHGFQPAQRVLPALEQWLSSTLGRTA